MRNLAKSLVRDTNAAAAAELALVAPLLLVIMFGSVELGNYFMNEHSLVKAVRDGARFAARQSFTNYTACSGSPGGTVVTDTQNIVMNGYLSGGTALTPNINAADIAVTTSCASTAGGESMLGIYRGRATGAQIVTVTATVEYRAVLGSLGFSGLGLHLNASSQAAVAGI
jgi:Flp pilus assembly protein TadG